MKLDADGVPEIVTGLSNGYMTVRRSDTGEVVFKRQFSSPIADLTVADYRMDPMNQVEQIVVCTEEGEVRAVASWAPPMARARPEPTSRCRPISTSIATISPSAT